MVKKVFLIIGTLVASVLLFTAVFGDVGRELIWTNIKGSFESEWQEATRGDGSREASLVDSVFQKSEDLSS